MLAPTHFYEFHCYYNQVIQINITKPINNNVKRIVLMTTKSSSLCSIKANYTKCCWFGCGNYKRWGGSCKILYLYFSTSIFQFLIHGRETQTSNCKGCITNGIYARKIPCTPSQDVALHVRVDVHAGSGTNSAPFWLQNHKHVIL